jgi:hypothetical protein
MHNGIPVTTVARTQIDLTDTLTSHQLANVIHEAAWRNRFNPRATHAAMERAHGRRRLHVLDRALELNAHGSAGTRSDHEDLFLKLMHSAGLPEPMVNVKVHVRGRDDEVDFRWHSRCVEVDGGGRTRPRTQREDQERDAALIADGYTILRFTADDLERQPSAVLARVRAAGAA